MDLRNILAKLINPLVPKVKRKFTGKYSSCNHLTIDIIILLDHVYLYCGVIMLFIILSPENNVE